MWDWFVNLLTSILAALQGFVGDWGLAIIVLTFIIRILLTPLMAKSSASNARMQLMQPKLTELQEKYADDPERQAEEMRKLYSEMNFNPLAGCLPMLLQMPIFFALFTVARQVPADASFFNILPSLGSSVSQMVAANGFGGAIVYVLFDVLFGVLTFVPMLLNNQAQSSAETRQQSIMMGAVMSVMMVWFGWSVPAAVLLYYDTSAIWQVVQQHFIVSRVMKQAREEAEAKMADAPVEVDVVRRERKKRPRKKA